MQISQLELQLRAQLHAATRAEQQRCDAVGLHAALTHDLSETQERPEPTAAAAARRRTPPPAHCPHHTTPATRRAG